MRREISVLVFAAAVLGMTREAGASSRNNAPTCEELQARKVALVKQAQAITADVEAKNVELGEAADQLTAAREHARKQELERRVDGLRRELNTLLDREHSTTDELGALDAEIVKRCGKGGRK